MYSLSYGAEAFCAEAQAQAQALCLRLPPAACSPSAGVLVRSECSRELTFLLVEPTAGGALLFDEVAALVDDVALEDEAAFFAVPEVVGALEAALVELLSLAALIFIVTRRMGYNNTLVKNRFNI